MTTSNAHARLLMLQMNGACKEFRLRMLPPGLIQGCASEEPVLLHTDQVGLLAYNHRNKAHKCWIDESADSHDAAVSKRTKARNIVGTCGRKTLCASQHGVHPAWFQFLSRY